MDDDAGRDGCYLHGVDEVVSYAATLFFFLFSSCFRVGSFMKNTLACHVTSNKHSR